MDIQDRSSFVGRMIGAARFERAVYRDLANDPSAMGQAAAVIVLGALAGGISGALSAFTLYGGSGGGFLIGLIASTLLVLLGWLTWSTVTWLVGTRLMHSQADFGAVARGLGFGQAPTLLRVFGFIPVIGGIISLIASFWALATGFFAIRESLRLGTGETIVTVVVGFIAYFIIVVVISATVVAGVLATGAGPDLSNGV